MKEYNGASSEAIVIPFNSLSPKKVYRNIAALSPEHFRDQACKLAGSGLRVFRLRPGGKEPAFTGWQHEATADTELVHARWSDPVGGDPLAFNIGVATGAGLLVLDVDNKDGKHGSASLNGLEARYGALPMTLTVRTPTGGYHYYFRVPADEWIGNSIGKLGEGLDVKGDGGYVVGPGSVLAKGQYIREPSL